MKKCLIFLFATVVVMASCMKESQVTENETNQPASISFNLDANHPDATRAVKSDWEEGDAIFVFFTGVKAPKHLKMVFDGNDWISAEYDGATLTPGALGLKNGDQGTMRAVFLPFGSDATVIADDTTFKFSTTYYAYYLTATLSYSVVDNEVNGAFDMMIPDGYVQFFIEDSSPTDGAYSLGTDAVIPTGIASISSNGSVNETRDKSASDDMTGYAYKNGYLFSGKLSDLYTSCRLVDYTQVNANAYYFAKTKTADGSRADYFVSDKPLDSHNAIKLPANGDSKWQAVGGDIYYDLIPLDYGSSEDSGASLGKWFTCNYGCSVPEQLGPICTFDDAITFDGLSLPSKNQFEELIVPGRADWVVLSVHGQPGMVIKATNAFIFLPFTSDDKMTGYYWSSEIAWDDQIWDLVINHMGGCDINYSLRWKGKNGLRPVFSELNPSIPVPSAVDLGLSVKWASFNLGASAPEEYGDYYAWGETEPKFYFYWDNYIWWSFDKGALLKYNTESSWGAIDNKTVLELADDAAHVQLGGSWRMPTTKDWGELSNNCTWTWTTLNGVYGRMVVSNIPGYTDKWIFLPAAGSIDHSNPQNPGIQGFYWASSINVNFAIYAWGFVFNSNVVQPTTSFRYAGVPVRPVSE